MIARMRIFYGLSAVAAAALVAAVPSSAALVPNNLSGTVQFDGWDQLGGISGYGFNDVGPFSGGPVDPNDPFGPSNPPVSWPIALNSFQTGSGDATLLRTAGGHYSASISLYNFAGPSDFTIGDSSAIDDLATVVFSILDWVGSSPTTPPLLNILGGAQGLAADLSSVEPAGQVFFQGAPVALNTRTFQWDLTAFGPVDGFAIDWTQGSSAGISALQLEQSTVFTVASAIVPEPGSLLLSAIGVVAAMQPRRRRGR
ncbi:MAG: hypothetical protein AAF596_01375 [Planctomycetota bacterium]